MTFPNLKELHSGYNGEGFEIVAISIDVTEEAWSSASDEHELPWINLGHWTVGRELPHVRMA